MGYIKFIYLQSEALGIFGISSLSELPMATLDQKSNGPSFGARPKSLDADHQIGPDITSPEHQNADQAARENLRNDTL